MDNESFKPEQSEEEYHFGEAEAAPASAAFSATDAAPSKATVFERIKRKNIFIAIIVIVLVLSVYKLLDVLFISTSHDKAHKSTNPTVVAKPTTITSAPISAPAPTPTPVSTPTSMPAAPIAGAPGQQPAIPSQPPHEAMPSAMADRLNTLEQQSAAAQAALDKLTTQMTDIQTSLSGLDSKIAAVSDALQKLVQQQQAVKQAQEQKKQTAKAAPKPVFFVRAMIPGRAWLITQDGSTITVSVGDTIPGYGVVDTIDANQGTVTMSSGAIIGYSPNDS